MNKMIAGSATLILLFALMGCDRIAPSTPKPSTAAPGAGAGSAASPTSGMVPHDPSKPMTPSTGPSEGSTAIGGMTGKQDSGGRNSGTTSPTGGDGSSAGGPKK